MKPPLRTKSVGTKVSEAEFALLEERARGAGIRLAEWVWEVPSSYKLFLGEYLWSPAWQHSDKPYYGNDGWVQPRHDCPVSVRTSAFEYHQESTGFDCAVDEGFVLHLPAEAIAKAMDLA